MSKILKIYEEDIEKIKSDLVLFADEQDELLEIFEKEYKLIKQYFNKEITFDEFMDNIKDSCPPNSCFWCDYKCDKCDICKVRKEGDSINVIHLGDCRKCWERCLNV